MNKKNNNKSTVPSTANAKPATPIDIGLANRTPNAKPPANTPTPSPAFGFSSFVINSTPDKIIIAGTPGNNEIAISSCNNNSK